MLGTVFRYELRYHLSRPITWLYFALFAVGSFMFMSTDAIQLAGVTGQIMRNSPWVVMRAELLVVTLGMIIIAGLVGSAILRDCVVPCLVPGAMVPRAGCLVGAHGT